MLLFMLSLQFILDISATVIDCIVVIGDATSTEGETSISKCPSTHTLTSCGFKNIQYEYVNTGGSYITNNTCYAKHQTYSAGVQSYARCCDLSQYGSIICNTHQSDPTPPDSDDTPTQSQCNQNLPEVLMGCTAFTEGGIIDGAFPGSNKWESIKEGLADTNNICTGYSGAQGTEIWSMATCCYSQSSNTVSFDCYRVRSLEDRTLINTGDQQEISCNVINDGYDYFLTSCSAIASWKNIDAWYIEDDTCYARNYAVPAPPPHNNAFILATEAICCRVTTQSPTPVPTDIPSSQTSSPSVNPSSEPSDIPSTSPSTTSPTISPSTTYDPTETPSQTPSESPSSGPSMIPSMHPSPMPTISPSTTLSPTEPPSMMPTSISPTSLPPTNDPSGTPSVNSDGQAVIDEQQSTEFPTSSEMVEEGATDEGVAFLGTNLAIWLLFVIIVLICCIIILFLVLMIRKIQMKQRKKSMNNINNMGGSIQMEKMASISHVVSIRNEHNGHEIGMKHMNDSPEMKSGIKDHINGESFVNRADLGMMNDDAMSSAVSSVPNPNEGMDSFFNNTAGNIDSSDSSDSDSDVYDTNIIYDENTNKGITPITQTANSN